MNLFLISASLQPGGAERSISKLANHLVSQGHQVSLITFASSEQKPFYPLHSAIQLVQLNKSENKVSILLRIKNIIKRIFFLRKTIKRLQPNLILSFVDVTNLTTLLAAYSLKIPVIVSERTHPAYHKLPFLYQKARKILYPKAYRVVVQTTSVFNYFSALNNLMVIPNAVMEPTVKKPEMLHNIKKVISVGRLCPFKGFDTLIYAFSKLRLKYNDLELIIYGEGADRKRLENLVQSLGLQEYIFLPGLVSDVYPVLLKADLFVFPSHYEGFPNALCEAMAVGLPVIASNCSGNVDIIQDNVNGLLFPVGDSEKLSQLIEKLKNNSAQCTALSLEARKICKKLSADVVFAKWDYLINSIHKD